MNEIFWAEKVNLLLYEIKSISAFKLYEEDEKEVSWISASESKYISIKEFPVRHLA